MENLLNSLSSIVWGPVTIIMLVGTGIFLTILIRCIQVSKFFYGISLVTGKFDNPEDEGEITHFQGYLVNISQTMLMRQEILETKNRLELARTVDFGQLERFAESNVVVNASGESDTEGHYRRTTDISNFSSNLVEIAIKVDLRNRRTLEFTPANEQLTSYIANYLESQEL